MLRSFLNGAGFAWAIHIAFEDYLGREGYIEFARSHWHSLPWGVGASLAIIFLCQQLSLARETKDRDEEEPSHTGTWPQNHRRWTPD